MEVEKKQQKVKLCLSKLKEDASNGVNIMEASIDCAHNGVTTGEWSNVMRDVFGEYRAPTGIVATHMTKITQKTLK